MDLDECHSWDGYSSMLMRSGMCFLDAKTVVEEEDACGAAHPNKHQAGRRFFLVEPRHVSDTYQTQVCADAAPLRRELDWSFARTATMEQCGSANSARFSRQTRFRPLVGAQWEWHQLGTRCGPRHWRTCVHCGRSAQCTRSTHLILQRYCGGSEFPAETRSGANGQAGHLRRPIGVLSSRALVPRCPLHGASNSPSGHRALCWSRKQCAEMSGRVG